MSTLLQLWLCLTVIFLAISFGTAAIQPGEDELNQPYNDLRTTFVPGLDAGVDGDLGGYRLPRTIPKIPPPEGTPECVNKFGDTVFHGYRVPQPFPGDKYVSCYNLYDKQGVIAGIQFFFPVEDLKVPKNTFRYAQVAAFRTAKLDGVDYYVLTAYFVDPETICTTGRAPPKGNEHFETALTLTFQNGPTPAKENLLLAPKIRSEAVAYGYTEQTCLPGMGNHTIYNVSTATDCDTMHPAYILQNKAGYMIGFGYYWVGFSKSGRFEHAPPEVLEGIVGAASNPKCLHGVLESMGLTTTHIFFTNANPKCKDM